MTTQFMLAPPQQEGNYGISCHAWNPDRTMIAISPNTNEIHIFDVRTKERKYTLTEHDMTVSSIDWSAAHNKIVSCSHDRNAYVWNFIPATADEPSYWKPGLVILRFDRAAIDVKWALDGMRFAATSGSKCIAVCTYEADHDWWVSKVIKKKIKSTVLCCAFHPTNGQLLATGSSDFKCRVFSTFSTEVDGTNVNAGPFGIPQEFGEPYCELSAMGWVNAVAWSPSGNVLAFAGHDSSIHFATFQGGNPVVQTVRFRELPFHKILFLSEAALVGAGHDYTPSIYNQNGSGQWAFYGKLEQGKQEAVAEQSSAAAARSLFQNKAKLGQAKRSDDLKSPHDNLVTGLSVASAGSISKLSTTSFDGKVVLWQLSDLGLDFSALRL